MRASWKGTLPIRLSATCVHAGLATRHAGRRRYDARSVHGPGRRSRRLSQLRAVDSTRRASFRPGTRVPARQSAGASSRAHAARRHWRHTAAGRGRRRTWIRWHGRAGRQVSRRTLPRLGAWQDADARAVSRGRSSRAATSSSRCISSRRADPSPCRRPSVCISRTRHRTTTPVMLRLGSKTLDIPAGSSTYEVIDGFKLPVDVLALSVYPHAHYLAKEMSVVARLPERQHGDAVADSELELQLAGRIHLRAAGGPVPSGTTIEMRYRYDNTSENPHNPFDAAAPRPVRIRHARRDGRASGAGAAAHRRRIRAASRPGGPQEPAHGCRGRGEADRRRSRRCRDEECAGRRVHAARSRRRRNRADRGVTRVRIPSCRWPTTILASSRWASSGCPRRSPGSSGRLRRGPTMRRRTTTSVSRWSRTVARRTPKSHYRAALAVSPQSCGRAQQPGTAAAGARSRH